MKRSQSHVSEKANGKRRSGLVVLAFVDRRSTHDASAAMLREALGTLGGAIGRQIADTFDSELRHKASHGDHRSRNGSEASPRPPPPRRPTGP